MRVTEMGIDELDTEVYFSSLMYLQGRQEGFAEGL